MVKKQPKETRRGKRGSRKMPRPPSASEGELKIRNQRLNTERKAGRSANGTA